MEVELREVETEEGEEWVEEGGEGGMEGGGGKSSSLRTRACVPAGEPASAAGERRRAFFARSLCICSLPCSCGSGDGVCDVVDAGSGGGGADGGRSGVRTKENKFAGAPQLCRCPCQTVHWRPAAGSATPVVVVGAQPKLAPAASLPKKQLRRRNCLHSILRRPATALLVPSTSSTERMAEAHRVRLCASCVMFCGALVAAPLPAIGLLLPLRLLLPMKACLAAGWPGGGKWNVAASTPRHRPSPSVRPTRCRAPPRAGYASARFGAETPPRPPRSARGSVMNAGAAPRRRRAVSCIVTETKKKFFELLTLSEAHDTPPPSSPPAPLPEEWSPHMCAQSPTWGLGHFSCARGHRPGGNCECPNHAPLGSVATPHMLPPSSAVPPLICCATPHLLHRPPSLRLSRTPPTPPSTNVAWHSSPRGGALASRAHPIVWQAAMRVDRSTSTQSVCQPPARRLLPVPWHRCHHHSCHCHRRRHQTGATHSC